MPTLRELQMGDEKKLIPLFKILTGKETVINTEDLIADDSAICMVII